MAWFARESDMGREVPFDEKAKCDECGRVGAYDFMGDLLCPECAEKIIEPGPDSDIANIPAETRAARSLQPMVGNCTTEKGMVE